MAPMADVTDAAFRRIITKYGKPDVMWTEFVSADGLAHKDARPKLLIDLMYTEGEWPIVAQIFGSQPENMREAAKLCVELGFDGIDINMGCPVKKILNQNSCSALIKNPKLAKEIILATKQGAGDIPVSVKTRIGFNKIEISTWIPQVLETKPAVLTIHLRTVKEMSLVPAHWELMPEIVALRDKLAPDTLIVGNGDVRDISHARELIKQTGCDGVMLGKAIFGNPWLFDEKKTDVTIEEKLKVMVEHTKLFEKLLGEHKNFAIMKKHYKAYANGFDGAKELRMKLMEAENADEIQTTVENFLVNI